MRDLLLKICYDGSVFHGWQVQKNALSVQEVFQNAVEKVFGERLAVIGCSRTDTGVHASCYYLTIKNASDISDYGVVMALNTKLPKEIAVLECTDAPKDFHPRYSCSSKEYIYKIYNGKIRNPFLEKYAYHYSHIIDAEYLHEQAQLFVGRHDFKGFCSAGSKIVDTNRDVKNCSVWRDGDNVYFKVEADGFLYNMVRIMTGTLLFIAQGKIEKDELRDIIKSGERIRGGKTAPPQGLYLNNVKFEGEWHERGT